MKQAQGISQIDQVTQQNTANAEQSASAAEELSSQANQNEVIKLDDVDDKILGRY